MSVERREGGKESDADQPPPRLNSVTRQESTKNYDVVLAPALLLSHCTIALEWFPGIRSCTAFL